MQPTHTRRDFLHHTLALATLAAPALAAAQNASKPGKYDFKISLAQWSLHRALRAEKLDNLDFAKTTRQDYGIEAIEYVNQFFKTRARDAKYLAELNKRAADHGVKQLLIMIDGEGDLGAADATKRAAAVKNHEQWVEAAVTLGCHSIRVNARSEGSYEDQLNRAADGLAAVADYGARHKINVIVENHGGLSSNGQWLSAVLKKVNSPWCGSLPDFGNFTEYDRYQGVTELMPFAKGVSAKSHDFDAAGNETRTDYVRMMKIVLDAGYHGYVGIEYEGEKLDEAAGIRATKTLLERVRTKLAGA